MNRRFSVDGLKKLDRLQSFNSTGFPLPGPIPFWFGSELPKSLNVLVISSAFVNGSVPYNIAQLGNLTVIDLSNNFISGSVPSTVGALSKLKILNFSKNRFTGSIPESIWLLELNVFNISGNNLSGILPEVVQAEVNPDVGVSTFDISNNFYYGSVSSAFGMYLKRFGVVDFSGNYFQGTVPLNDNITNHSYGLNCFRSALNQRNLAECEEFYKFRKVALIGPMTPKLAASPPTSPISRKKKSQLWKYILIGFFGFIGLIVTAVFMFVFCCMRAKTHTSDQEVGVRAITSGVGPPMRTGAVSKNRLSLEQSITYNLIGKETFTFEQLVQATSEFSDANLIRKGHSGDLYNGVLENGFSVVVKRIDTNKLMHKGYVAELESLAKCSNIRIVPFLGQCLEKENEKFMVYKKIKHGDLSTALYNNNMKMDEEDKEGLTSLDWITRLKIAVGTAESLSFLHHECKPPLVHRDVQASSILLDDKFEVRLGSLSDVCTQVGDGNQGVFTRFLRRSQASEQSMSGSSTATCTYDIHCFGKVLLELVTGKLGLSGSMDPIATEFIDHTLQQISTYDKETITKLVDPSLILDEDLTQEAWAVMVIAKSCLNPMPSRRPVARYVLKALENPLKILRMYSGSNSMGLRTLSSRASWHGAFMGSWRHSSDSMVGPGQLKKSGTDRSQGSLGDHSFSYKRRSMEIFPEPINGMDNGYE